MSVAITNQEIENLDSSVEEQDDDEKEEVDFLIWANNLWLKIASDC